MRHLYLELIIVAVLFALITCMMTACSTLKSNVGQFKVSSDYCYPGPNGYCETK